MFNIDNFNVIQDDNNYYVFRSLEAGDVSDINNGITNLMRTDRERYKRTPKYNEDSNISLEEMFDHIKIHYRLDTNCISFTTNAGIAIMYGRDKDTYKDGNFNDQYKILRIPKNELGTISHFAPDYMISEISKLIDEYYEHADSIDQYLLDRIDNCVTQDQLDSITKNSTDEDIFEGGITFNTNTNNYSTLSSKQNLEKNKLIAKIDLIPYNLVSNVSNKFLIQTIGSAFASMEVTHYKSIDNKYLIDCPNNIIDIFSILQQSNNSKVSEIENIIIDKLSKGELSNLEEFKYYNYELTEDDLSIENLYNVSDNGKVDYDTMRNLYIKTFYLAKSKLRTYHSIKLLKEIIGIGYDDVLDELSSTYGIEPEITNKRSIDKTKLSDSIGLDYSTDIEKRLLKLLTSEYSNQLDFLINNKQDCASIVMLDLLKDLDEDSKEDYYVNAIIDSFDWKQFNISSIDKRHRLNLINKLKESDFMLLYEELKNNNYSYKEISRILLANIINENDTIDYNSTFTIEDLEDYLGYFKVKDKNIKLTRYQADAIRNMRDAYKVYQYTNVILPTGTGKSYVAITEMLEYLNASKKVLYLAPDTEILNQIRYYLVSEVIGDSFGEDLETIVQKRYPNLILQTYSYLVKGTNSKDIINDKYDFIVTDELHRTGALETKPLLEELYKNQDKNSKVLGITATPTRDCDGVDMAEYWAKFFGYKDEDIYADKHLAYNMDYNQAITLGYLENPRVINCEYQFLTESEEIQKYKKLVNDLDDKNEKERLFNKLRKDISNTKGIPEILKENVLPGDACLVFCPVVNFDETTGEKITGEQVIEKYTKKLEEIYGKDKINCYSMLSTYSAKENNNQLEKFQNVQSDKINFMIVIGKMNEGKHGNYNKLIWFRPLGDNSFVLCSQQLGRISKLRKRGKVLSDEERPLAIDLPNNLLRIQGTKELRKSIDSDDISKFRLVVDWIKQYNKIPEINSLDTIESSMASILKVIIFKYHNKINNIESINSVKKKIQTKEIKRLSEELEFDIWDLRISKRTKETKKRLQVPYYMQANALYRDYIKINDYLINNLTSEQRIEEIYAIYEKTGKMPNTNCQELFSNGVRIGPWIQKKNNQEIIMKLAQEGNEHAKVIVKLLKLDIKIELSDEQRIEEIYAIYEKTGKMPNTICQELFSNGAKISSWIKNYQETIIKLAQEGNEHAKVIVEMLKLDIIKIELSDEQRIEEIYAIYEKTGTMPNTRCQELFSNGVKIRGWIQKKNNQEKIIKLAQEGNEHAKVIVEMLKLDIKIELSDEQRIEEIYAIYEKTGKMPNTQSQELFSNGVRIGPWINTKKNQETIMKLAQEGNEHAKVIVEMLKLNIKIELSDEQRIEETYAIYEKTGKMPNTQCQELFSNGVRIGPWINRKNNQETIIKLAQEGNEHAKVIVKLLKLDIKIELSDEQRIEEIYAIYEKTGTMPNTQCQELFSNGVRIGPWINKKKNQETIMKLAQEGNKHAKVIVEMLKLDIIKIELSDEQRIEEIYAIYEKTGTMPNTSCQELFSNGVRIGPWINTKKNQETIMKLAQEGNKHAQVIASERQLIKINYVNASGIQSLNNNDLEYDAKKNNL